MTLTKKLWAKTHCGRQPGSDWLRNSAAVVLLLLCTGCELITMARFSYDDATASYTWSSEAREAVVPFTLVDNHIILPVRVNGSKPLNFVLDSGAAATVIMDSQDTRTLQLQTDGELTVSGVGEGPHPVAHLLRGLSLELGALQIQGQSAVYLPLDQVPFFHDLDDVYFDGVLGAPLFKRFSVAIDYDRQVVTFHEPNLASIAAPPGEWQLVPLQIEGGVPYLTTRMANDEGELVAVKLLVDTGARGTVSITTETHAGLYAPQSYFPAVSQGLSGNVPSRVTLSESLALGPYQLGTVPVSYAMAGGESERDSNGLVGNEVLRRFNSVFDYANGHLLLQPNQHFAEPMPADRSGLLIRPHRLGAIVRAIAPDTGAADSALQVGDIITSFDAIPVSRETVGALKKVLASDASSVYLCWHTSAQSQCGGLVLATRFRTRPG